MLSRQVRNKPQWIALTLVPLGLLRVAPTRDNLTLIDC